MAAASPFLYCRLMNRDNCDRANAYDVDPSPDPHLIFQARLSGENPGHIERCYWQGHDHHGVPALRRVAARGTTRS
jgi:hypothetical protein